MTDAKPLPREHSREQSRLPESEFALERAYSVLQKAHFAHQRALQRAQSALQESTLRSAESTFRSRGEHIPLSTREQILVVLALSHI